MKRVLIIPLFVLCHVSFAQQIRQCEATVFVEFDYKDYISVYDSDDSDAAIKIRNLCEIDKYVEIQITGNKGDLFRVNLGFECLGSELTVKNAFIHKEHLVVMSKMLASPMPLYESPSADSRIIHRVANSYGYTYHVLDCDGSWLKVSYLTHEGVKHVGWMAKQYQCTNPYTACMGG